MHIWVSVSTTKRISLNIPCRASLLRTNSIVYVCLRKSFISPSVLKDNFTGYWIQDRWAIFFSFQRLNISLYSLLALHGFWIKVQCNSYPCSSIGMFPPYPIFFQDFLFVVDFLMFEYYIHRRILFVFILLGSFEYLDLCFNICY